jgi:hypothetical protein
MFIAEGERVVYTGSGEPDAPLAHGDEGVVIMAAGPSGSHVQWTTGECVDHISLTANRNLEPVEPSPQVVEAGYTETPQVHLAVCPTCAGEGMIPEED